MPLYTYLCENEDCEQEEFEEIRSFSESDDPAECPKCGEKAKKIPSVNAKCSQWKKCSQCGIV